MIGEVSIGGVYFPSLLLFVLAATVLTALLTRLLSLVGFSHLVVFRPLTDLALFVLLLAVIIRLTARWGLRL